MTSQSPVAISTISAVVAPGILILACGSLIATTANRLSLLLDRVRELTKETEAVHGGRSTVSDVKRAFIASQLSKGTRRTRLLQRALAVFYLALCFFIITCVVVGFGPLIGLSANLAIGPMLIAIMFLFYASALLILESRIARFVINAEMDYVRSLIDQNQSA